MHKILKENVFFIFLKNDNDNNDDYDDDEDNVDNNEEDDDGNDNVNIVRGGEMARIDVILFVDMATAIVEFLK